MSTYAVISLILIAMTKVNGDILKIIEEQRNGTEIPSVSKYLKSIVTNQQTNFQLIEDNKLSGCIAVNSQTRNVTVKSRIDRESLCHSDTIRCKIPLKFLLTPLYETISIDVEVADINDNTPSWPYASISRDIIEHDGKKFEEHNLYVDKATDPDANENGSVSYFLAENDGVTENKDFKIRNYSPGSKRLTLYPLKIIDKELINSYDMILLAQDQGSPRRTGSLLIKVFVLDKNDNSPTFDRQQYRNDSLSEMSIIGSEVLTVSATDNDSDENGKISYRIDDRTAQQYFDIGSNGKITVRRKLDYDNGIKSFRFNVIAFDNAQEAYRKSSECEVLINLKDENDEKPEILIHVTTKNPVTNQPTINENQVTRNLVLAHVQVKDVDYGGTDRVTCTLTENRKMILEVSSSSNSEYQILATSSFDREQQSKEKVEIICFDQAKNKAQKSIVFQITDENDNSPTFAREFHFTVKENSTNQILFVGDIRAEDKDEGINAKIVYEIEGESPYFRIDSTGRIYTKRILDREEISRFNLTVLAKDGGVPQKTGTTTVIIIVTDVNDWKPEFNATLYEFSIVENSRLGSTVGFLTATDRDLPSNTFLKYRISTSYLQKLPFKVIKNQIGEIITTQRLDREQQNIYQFMVIAEDQGRPISFTSTATVKVTVTDVNDNPPVFITHNYTKFSVQMTELVGSEIGYIRATDADLGENGLVEYTIIAGNLNKYFDLNLSTGKLNLAFQIPRSGETRLVIEACDKGLPRLCSGPLWIIAKLTNERSYVESHTDSKTFIFIICVLVILLLIILILVICAILFKNRLCIPVTRTNSGDLRTNEANSAKNPSETRYPPSSNNESLLIPNYPTNLPAGSTMMRDYNFESNHPFRERQVSSDYQSIDGGSPSYNPGPVFNWEMASMHHTIDDRLEPLYSGHRSVKDYYSPGASVPFPGSYCTYNTSRFRPPCYGIRMTNIPRDHDTINELPPRNSDQKRYSSLLNLDSVSSRQDNYNYKSLRKPNPKASFV